MLTCTVFMLNRIELFEYKIQYSFFFFVQNYFGTQLIQIILSLFILYEINHTHAHKYSSVYNNHNPQLKPFIVFFYYLYMWINFIQKIAFCSTFRYTRIDTQILNMRFSYFHLVFKVYLHNFHVFFSFFSHLVWCQQ